MMPNAYTEAKPDIERRGLNQAVFAGFWVAGREVEGHQLQQPYGDLLEADLPDPACSNRDYVAAGLGFEPRNFRVQSAAPYRLATRHCNVLFCGNSHRGSCIWQLQAEFVPFPSFYLLLQILKFLSYFHLRDDTPIQLGGQFHITHIVF